MDGRSYHPSAIDENGTLFSGEAAVVFFRGHAPSDIETVDLREAYPDLVGNPDAEVWAWQEEARKRGFERY